MNKNINEGFTITSAFKRTFTQHLPTEANSKDTVSQDFDSQFLQNRLIKIGRLKSKGNQTYKLRQLPKRRIRSHLQEYANKTSVDLQQNDVDHFTDLKAGQTCAIFKRTSKVKGTQIVQFRKNLKTPESKAKYESRRASINNMNNGLDNKIRISKSQRENKIASLVSHQNNFIQQNSIQSSSRQNRENLEYEGKLKQICSHFNQENLYGRLSRYSKQVMKQNLRIYREDLQIIVSNRYGNSKILSYLGLEYIQDFYSIKQTIEQILKFTRQQILLFCFLIMNQNRDGLVGPDDVVSFIGIHKEGSTTNPLIMEDLYSITEYLKQKQKQDKSLMDAPSISYKFLLDQNLTLVKYRIILHKKKRKSDDMEAHQRKNKLISRRMHQYLYTLRNQDEEECKPFNKKYRTQIANLISFSLNLKSNNLQIEKKQNYQRNFAINFTTFKEIYHNKIPKMYIDFLFVFGGVEMPNQNYAPIDFQCLKKNQFVKPITQQQKGLTKVKKMLEKMRSINQFTQFVLKQVTKN